MKRAVVILGSVVSLTGCGAIGPTPTTTVRSTRVITRVVTAPARTIVRTTAVTAPPEQSPAQPDRALCSHLYAEWAADGSRDPVGAAAIEQYAQIGCDQTPRTDGNTWCKTFTATTGDGSPQQVQICDFPPGTPGASPP